MQLPEQSARAGRVFKIAFDEATSVLSLQVQTDDGVLHGDWLEAVAHLRAVYEWMHAHSRPFHQVVSGTLPSNPLWYIDVKTYAIDPCRVVVRDEVLSTSFVFLEGASKTLVDALFAILKPSKPVRAFYERRGGQGVRSLIEQFHAELRSERGPWLRHPPP